jgi:hypothetical protein
MTPFLLIQVASIICGADGDDKSMPFDEVSWRKIVDVDSDYQTPVHINKKIQRHIRTISTEELDGVTGNQDLTLALAAGWERVRRVSLKDRRADDDTPFDKTAVMRFLGFVEARTRATIPARWEKLILSGKYSSRSRMAIELPYWEDERLNDSTKPVSDGDAWKIDLGKRTLRLPKYALDARGWTTSDARVWTTSSENSQYFILHDAGTSPCILTRIDEGKANPEWRARVWCTVGVMSGGSLEVYRWISDSKDEIVVFAAARYCFSIEVFEKSTGRNIGRLLTECFEE